MWMLYPLNLVKKDQLHARVHIQHVFESCPQLLRITNMGDNLVIWAGGMNFGFEQKMKEKLKLKWELDSSSCLQHFLLLHRLDPPLLGPSYGLHPHSCSIVPFTSFQIVQPLEATICSFQHVQLSLHQFLPWLPLSSLNKLWFLPLSNCPLLPSPRSTPFFVSVLNVCMYKWFPMNSLVYLTSLIWIKNYQSRTPKLSCGNSWFDWWILFNPFLICEFYVEWAV